MSEFIKGAWLYTLDKELTEQEFIEKAGGMEKLRPFKRFPYVSIVLDGEQPLLVGHINGRTIKLVMSDVGHKLWQTMEWEK